MQELVEHRVRGSAKKKKSTNPRLLWKWVDGSRSHSVFVVVGKSSQNSPKPVVIFWSSIPCVFCLYALLKVVGYYDLSVLSMSVMCFQKKPVWIESGWVGGVSCLRIFFGIFWIFYLFKAPKHSTIQITITQLSSISLPCCWLPGATR